MTDAPAPEPRAPAPERATEAPSSAGRWAATRQERARRAVLGVAQAHLRVGSVNDPAEREADHVASQVVALLRRSPQELRPEVAYGAPSTLDGPPKLHRSTSRSGHLPPSLLPPPTVSGPRVSPLVPMGHQCGPGCIHRHAGHQHAELLGPMRLRRSPTPVVAPTLGLAASIRRVALGTLASHRCGPDCVHRHAGHPDHQHDRDPAAGPAGGELGSDLTARIARMSGRGRPLDEPVRRSMEGAFGADFSGVRVHEDSDIAPQIGAEAFTSGRDIHFAPGAFQPADRQGQWLLGHELTHVVQQHGDGLDGVHRHAEGSCIMRHASKEHYLLGTLTPEQIKDVADDKARSEQPHAAHDDDDPVPEENGLHIVQQQIAALEHWKTANLENPDPAKVAKGGTDYDPTWGGQLLTLTCKDGLELVCTVGEMNALPDFIGAFDDLGEIDRRIIFRTLQVIRRETYIYLKGLEAQMMGHEHYTYDPDDKDEHFRGLAGNKISINNPLLFKGANDLSDMMETDQMLAGKHSSQQGSNEVGLDESRGGDATLGRNACHFPPESWLRWREYHTQARSLIAASTSLDQLQLNANKAIGMNAFGEHYLQDSFASGHLINKGWVMAHAQKYMSFGTKWNRASESYRAMMEKATKHEEAYELPGAAKKRLDAQEQGTQEQGTGVLDDPNLKARDPQSALDSARNTKPTDRPITTKDREAGKKQEITASGFDPKQVTWEQYRTWLSDAWLQKITNSLHDLYCVQGLTVKSPDSSTSFKIYGDSHMMESSEGAAYTAATSKLSRDSINALVENKRKELTAQQAKVNGSEPPQVTPPVDVPSVEAIVARFPNTVVVGNTDMRLVDWATGKQMEKKIEEIANSGMSVESFVSLVSVVKPVASGLTPSHGPF